MGGIGRTMLSGFNTNFRYRGVLFHVQTEDSGLDNPHVITHLFHGGNIMASQKRDYSSRLGEGEIEDAVRKLMEGQHKAMLKQLSRGEHDEVIRQRLGAEIFEGADEMDLESPSVTEEATPADISVPPVVVAEPTAAGDPDPLAHSFGADAILQPEFDSGLPTSGPPAAPSPAKLDDPDKSLPSQHPPGASAQLSRVFGDRVVSEKPLDEVVMDYLVDNARKRKRQPK